MPVKFVYGSEAIESEDVGEGLQKVLERALPALWDQLDGLIFRREDVKRVAEKIVPEPFDWKQDTARAARAITAIGSPKATRMLAPRNKEEKEIMKALLAYEVLRRIRMIE